ncbi:SDR family oxidoreductase [Aneurinibacillus sp. REN35]|uniref:SDR family oxidoreductase n=1 Tax=Aneurinibacillus sp. REN35 TaxID=3237286 RepID=UPI003528963C
MNILLTGGTGFVGGALTTVLLTEGHHVHIVVRSIRKAHQFASSLDKELRNRLHIIEGDITLPFLGIKNSIRCQLEKKIDAFYHIAALVKFDESMRETLFSINYNGTAHALELAASLSIPRFFYVSTAYTVGRNEHGHEKLYDIRSRFNNPYEESKCRAEHLVFSYQDQMHTSIFRPSIIVGDSTSGKSDSTVALYGFIRGIHVFQRRIMAKSDAAYTYRIHAASKGTSNLVPIDYVCRVLFGALTNAESGTIYSITNAQAPTNEKILSLICDHLGLADRLVSAENPQDLSADELLLNELIAAYEVYMHRHIQFTDTNTQLLLSNAGLPGLSMDEAMLTRIINGYHHTTSTGTKKRSVLV